MDARELLTKYRRDLDTEIAKARADAGLSNGRTIYSRFE
jgi:hypothetical protein